MSIEHAPRISAPRDGKVQTPVATVNTPGSATTDAPVGPARTQTPVTALAAKALAVTRIVVGFVFLWAFLDKLFGWHYATAGNKAWIHGGSPTKGFLSGVDAGPFQTMFHNMAGTTWADWLFMLALLGIGLALTLGVALRVTAVAGTALLALMWAAEWPLAQHTATGAPSMSTNPLVDYHFIYAVVIIALAVAGAGATWGLAKIWNALPVVRDHTWLH